MNKSFISRAVYGLVLLCLFTAPVLAQSSDVIDGAKATFQDVFMTEMTQQAATFPGPINLVFPCKSVTWDDGVAIIAAIEGTLDLSNREFLNGSDLMFVYLSQEVEEGKVLNVPNGFYAVSLLPAADGTHGYQAQFKDAKGTTVAEVPVQMSQMLMEGTLAGVDVGVGHNQGTAYLDFHWKPYGSNQTRWLRFPWYYIPTPPPPTEVPGLGKTQGDPIHGVDVKPGLRNAREEATAGIVLHESYPNPFNPATTLSFTLPAAMPVTLRVYDLAGREVATLVEGVREAGAHTVQFDAGHLASGTYLYRLEAGASSQTRRFTLVK